MDLSLNLFSIIILLSVFQGFFLSIIIFFIKTGNKKANRILSLFIVSISISISTIFILESNFYIYAPFLFRIYEPLQFIFGPLLLLYVNYMTDKSYKIKAFFYINFLPFILYIISLVPFFLSGFDNQLKFVNSILSNKANLYNILFEVATNIYMIIYILFSYFKVKTYQWYIKDNYSLIDEINLNWLKLFLKGIIIVYLFFIIPFVLMIFGFNMDIIVNLISAIVSFSIFVFSYISISKSKIFTGIETQINYFSKNAKYSTSPLTKDEINSHWNDILSIIKSEKLYLDKALSLNQLSEKAGLSRQYLSQIINQCTGGNFYDFINKYRVEEAKRLLTDPEYLKKFTILSAAFDSGFNSKATFNSIFKKVTGKTPSEYIKSTAIIYPHKPSTEHSIEKISK